MSLSPFDITSEYTAIQSRLERAEWYIQQFAEIANSFVKDDPYAILSHEHRHEGNQVSVRLEVELRRDVPPELSLYASEILHHLRSSLDNAIWSIGQRHGASADIAFPIAEKPKLFPLDPSYAAKSRTRNAQTKADLLKLPNKVRTIITDVQPYHGLESGPYVLLTALRRWSNADKHRVPIVGAASVRSNFVRPVKVGQLDVLGFGYNRPLRFKGQKTVMGLGIGADVESDPDFDVAVESRVVFDAQLGTLGDTPAADVLEHIYRYVRDDIIARLQPFFHDLHIPPLPYLEKG